MKFPDISWTVRGTWHVKCYSYHARSNVTVSGVENIENIKDLGVTFDNKLKFDKHTNNKINTAYQMLKIVKRNFSYLTPDSFVVLYKAMIRSHLEYAVSVWNPHHQSLIEKLEKVQKRATKLVINVKKLHYEKRLRRLKLPTQKYRRIRGAMIELGMLIPGYLDTRVPCGLPRSRPGSHETSDLPSYRESLHQSTDCPCGHIQTKLLAAAESAEWPMC